MRRAALLCGALVAALASGLVELLALQRQRYHAWRLRQHAPEQR